MADKAEIIEAIRAIAARNDGRPPGRRLFSIESGIKESEWMGRHWARWSDAVREAGFQPNEKQARRADADLLLNLAGLVRHLGHFPVAAEIRMQAQRSPEFPSHNTFARFGSLPDLCAALLHHCDSQPELSDVAAICRAAIEAGAASPAQTAEDRQEGPTGYVYLVKFGRFYKLGRTNDMGRRTYEIGLQLPEKPTLVHSIETDDPAGIEAYWHRRFADRRRNGEWFDLSSSDVRTFKRRTFM